MKLEKVEEGAAELFVPRVSKITAKNPAFFNPVQVVNRDISVLIASCLLKKGAAALDLLSATGVRAIRFAKETGLKNVFANDANPVAVKLIGKNAANNKVNLKIFNLRAHEFLAAKYKHNPKIYFDYVDIDPFGTPVSFLDAAVKALVPRGGIIAVTATDTANLCGVNVLACKRIYGAIPLHNELMHEIGIRILLKKIIEVGAQYDIALTPIFVHSTLHYMRVYLRADSGAKKADEILKNVGWIVHCPTCSSTNLMPNNSARGAVCDVCDCDFCVEPAGQMWLGQLWDENLVEKMFAAKDKFKLSDETKKLLFTILAESKIPVFGFYDLAIIKFKQTPKINSVISRLHAAGFAAARTHFSESGVRTNAPVSNFMKILK